MDLHKITVLPHSHFIKENVSRMDQLLTGLLQRVQHTSRCAGMGCRVLLPLITMVLLQGSLGKRKMVDKRSAMRPAAQKVC